VPELTLRMMMSQYDWVSGQDQGVGTVSKHKLQTF